MAPDALKPGDLVTVWQSGLRRTRRVEVDVVGQHDRPWFTYKYLPRTQDSVTSGFIWLAAEGVVWLRGWSDENDAVLAATAALS